MKAYKVVRQYKGRYFSGNALTGDIEAVIKNGSCHFCCVEYKIDKWVTASKEAPKNNKDLFIFETLAKAKSYKDFSPELLVFECEVDKIKHETLCSENPIDAIVSDSAFCRKIKLTKLVG